MGSGLLWALAAAFLSLQRGGVGKVADAYMATAGLILLASILEDSYVLAYYDELTRLPSRRAYKEALLRLVEPYTIAAVDIDHFKSFNDTHGHETGDQVLRLVAAKLAGVTGGGEAFRVGGEEFSILFSGRSATEVVEHLERLRRVIAEADFHLRAIPERREAPVRNADRRAASRRRPRRASKLSADQTLSVTVSIGVAESKANKGAVEGVIEAADRALYKAKREGRNRVEVAGRSRARGASPGRITA
jgi:diguanylate cyclase (GGDEF)-like protein